MLADAPKSNQTLTRSQDLVQLPPVSLTDRTVLECSELSQNKLVDQISGLVPVLAVPELSWLGVWGCTHSPSESGGLRAYPENFFRISIKIVSFKAYGHSFTGCFKTLLKKLNILKKSSYTSSTALFSVFLYMKFLT